MRDPNHVELARVQADRDRLQHNLNHIDDEIARVVDEFNERVRDLIGRIQSETNRKLVEEIERLRATLRKAVT